MSWLVEERMDNPSLTLKKLLEQKDILGVVGVFNPMSALIARQVGFECCYLSGAALTASLGMPDLSLIELNEVATMSTYIYRASGLPIIVDTDVGFGETLNVAKTAKTMQEAKAAAIQIEDQELPKKCGHLSGKKVVEKERMVQKIQAAKKVAKDLLIVARTDAKAVEGLKNAIDRANSYVEAGADIIFPEALETKEEFKEVALNVKAPLLANMTEFGKTPYITLEEFRDLGYKIVIYPVSALRAANYAIKKTFEYIKKHGTQKGILDQMQTRQELYELIKYSEYENFDKAIFEKK
ncbi:MAG: methylisocitrate lyase [Desulfurella sp.]|uniref:Methylisocitrate lyase n=1 Tax=Desulfurella multipotens TaxID=79269 RepID=A0A1G6N8Q3_9BACT|nr:methylisocitrate lyase [Desulfurella multipotens]SDC63636.1 carboxyvinyl-carboxyphosphonate phosphorylmutase [Desulfurella multipotens]